jgi:hypothetical protein
VAAYLEWEPRQWIVLGARDDRENAECDEQASRSIHLIDSLTTYILLGWRASAVN